MTDRQAPDSGSTHFARADGSGDYTAYRGPDGRPLNENHAKMLAAAGITAGHAALRGYETITRYKRLEEMGFSREASRRVAGLLIPLLDKRGATWGYTSSSRRETTDLNQCGSSFHRATCTQLAE